MNTLLLVQALDPFYKKNAASTLAASDFAPFGISSLRNQLLVVSASLESARFKLRSQKLAEC